jgi:hypothetical protein
MVSKEYLHTAQTLLRLAKKMTDQTIANRLMALADDYERRGRKANVAEAATAVNATTGRAESGARAAKSG